MEGPEDGKLRMHLFTCEGETWVRASTTQSSNPRTTYVNNWATSQIWVAWSKAVEER